MFHMSKLLQNIQKHSAPYYLDYTLSASCFFDPHLSILKAAHCISRIIHYHVNKIVSFLCPRP